MEFGDDSDSGDNITIDNGDKHDGGSDQDDDYLLHELKWVENDLLSDIPDFEGTSELSNDINIITFVTITYGLLFIIFNTRFN